MNQIGEIPFRLLLKGVICRILQIAYVAALRIIQNLSPEQLPNSVVVATAFGALDETKNFLDGVYSDGFGSPRNFITSVHNSIAGKVALEFKIKGPNITICDGQNSLASAIGAVDLLLPENFPVLLLCIDERIELLDTIVDSFNRSGKNCGTSSWKDGCVGFLIGESELSGKYNIRASGPVPANATDDYQDISALQPAKMLFEHVNNRHQKPLKINSYSPVSKSCAVIEVITNVPK